MIDRKALLADLQKQVKALEKDLREQVETAVDLTGPAGGEGGGGGGRVRDRLDAEYALAFRLGRTAATKTAWRAERVTQAAVAWVLGTVFVRFCEDNGLLTTPYLAGPTPERMVLAEEAQEEFFRLAPAETDRGWLLAAFGEIAGSQAGALLFDRRHNPLYQIPISHDAAKELIAFWRRRGEDGRLVHDFVSADWDTRFLGDLYQDLSEAARKTYALLQTPEFVEEFILDHTLTPAIEEFGHEDLRMIDPTCGSGHFVLGAFHRLLAEWERQAPARDRRELVRRALTSVHGVDLNPFAVAVARFRLFIAALRESGFTTLEEARGYEFPLNLAVGDSLIKSRQVAIPGMETDAAVLRMASGQRRLFGVTHEQEDLFEQAAEAAEEAGYGGPSGAGVAGVGVAGNAGSPGSAGGAGSTRSAGADEARDELAEFAYDTEDVHEFPGILREGSYHVVVGNPPYITVKDKKLNALYRALYSACAGAYALSVPFAQRFFELARRADNDGRGAGYVGQITSNSFMKREFGKTLIEEFFAKEVELTHIIDSSGAYIPGHGTPTAILFGRNKRWKRREKIRLVLGVHGEPGTPRDPKKGEVWQSILKQTDGTESENRWTSMTDADYVDISKHPWSLSGGGAKDLLKTIESAPQKHLSRIASSIGFGAVTREDSAYMIGSGALRRRNIPVDLQRPLVEGETIRDWNITDPVLSVWPYDGETLEASADKSTQALLWPNRAILKSRIAFGKSQIDRGLTWFEYSMFFRSRFGLENILSAASVATHAHFSLDSQSRVFKDTAIVIALPERAAKQEYLGVLGVLNSSTCCFWMKQACQPKGGSGIGRGVQDEPWEQRYQFNGANISRIPIAPHTPQATSIRLNSLSVSLSISSPGNVVMRGAPSRDRLRVARDEWHSVRTQMIALQEELDWEVYSLYGLLDDDLTAPADAVPELKLGERAFEIVLARRMARAETETQWFKRHGSTPIVELPDHWSPEYRSVVERRIALIETDRNIGLIERPECKRRWATEGWDAMQAKALRGWLLDRCEARELWFHHLDGSEQPRVLTTAQLADLLRPDADFVSVAELYAPGKDLEKVVADLVADEHVPCLAQLRYKDSGLVKRADWEDVWERQRREDAAQAVADAAGEAAKRQREIVEALDAADDAADAAEDGGKHGEERERAHTEWVRLSAEHRKAEDEVRRIRDAIPVPPKYGSGDFLKTSYWRNRGKLDVPKERFVSYPHASRDGDPALLLGWAGWDHREQAQALATLIVDREQSHGWGAERLAPLLAGLREVLPWVRQWHDEFDHMYGATPADLYEGFLVQTRDRLHLTDDDLTAWRPPKRSGTRKVS
ncbi:BREX-2 system adenine-specific DNA-methyltransferase PglX [Streptosporangium sandarakinum]|uniref:BREX-2 system adenine-specific DNA-methyltransferase PglX n=1 Tax=Streptosporangium sandarakinum TaxID=1260955 RepID=UPI00371FC8CB